MAWHVEPEAVVIAASAMISDENIVWIRNPVASRSSISVKERERRLSVDYEVILDAILCLYAILNEDSVALCVVVDILDDPEVLNTM